MKKRREAYLVKDVDPMSRLLIAIIPRRYDATNSTYLHMKCQPMDDFIVKMRDEKGIRYSYRDILIAAINRTMAMRPRLNRFVMNGRTYERYKNTICFMVKTSLHEESEEILIKLHFNGNETLEEVRQITEESISRNLQESQDNKMGETANALGILPTWMIKALVGFLRWSDRHNRLPKAILEASPFHNSCFITDLKSIKAGPIIHHCYDFGTVGAFVAMGKEEWRAEVDDEKNIVPGKYLGLGVNTDERFCDGLYWAKSFHMIRKYLYDPTLLFEPYHNAKIDAEIEKDRIKAEKEAKKAAKKNKKK